MIEWKHIHDIFLNQYSPVRNNRYAGEEINNVKPRGFTFLFRNFAA
jgi:hypothetical protein